VEGGHLCPSAMICGTSNSIEIEFGWNHVVVSTTIYCNVVMTIEHPRHFVINHGCHINEINVMKIKIPHLVTTSSSTSHMPH